MDDSSRAGVLASARWTMIAIGGVAAGIILAFSVVGSADFHAGTLTGGQDARAYWAAVRGYPYGADPGEFGAYLYSPAFLHAFNPVLALPWQQFLAGWTGLLLAALLVLTGPALFVIALPLAFFEIWGGNIHLLLALAVVAGFRWPAAWAFVVLTKVTPGIGLLWFAVRREWRSLAVALGATGAVVALSLALQPDLWVAWIELLVRESGDPVPTGAIPVPLIVRLPLAALVCIFAARTERRWLLPVVATLALPVLWWGSLSLLIGSVAIERRRVEAAITDVLARAPVVLRPRVQRAGWLRSPATRP